MLCCCTDGMQVYRMLLGLLLSFLMAMCRVRISLGLKPLSLETEKEQRQKEAAAREAKRAEEEKEAKAAELAEKFKTYVLKHCSTCIYAHPGVLQCAQ